MDENFPHDERKLHFCWRLRDLTAASVGKLLVMTIVPQQKRKQTVAYEEHIDYNHYTSLFNHLL